jgi:hypothetical protein
VALTNRELASLILLGAAAVLAFRKDPSLPSGLLGALRPILYIFVLFVAWMAVVVYAFAQLGLWEPWLFKDTLIWFGAGFALILNADRAGKEENFFRRRGLEPISVAALVGIFVNEAGYDVVPELGLQLLALLVIVMSVMPADKRTPVMSRLYVFLTAVVAVALFAPPLIDLAGRLGTIDFAATARFFLLPVWMTLFALPFVYVLATGSAFESALNHLQRAAERQGRPLPLWMKLAVILSTGFSLRGASRVTGMWAADVVKTTSFREARRVLKSLKAGDDLKAAVAAKAAADLERYAGIAGVDIEGRQLDRREFAATTNALELLDAYASADFRDGRYRADVATRNGGWMFRLPDDHGIVVEVSKSGKAYRAWRRTPSGWCFAVGRSKNGLTTQYYDGPEPPTTFPPKPPWSDGQTLNWLADDV